MMVSLVGAGPGDKGLLTLKGAQRIKNAEFVLYDRFVSGEILAMIPDSAEKIDVGKNAGNHPVPQEEINRILLEKALQGFNVVRLKGGDPFVFGRGGEELELLAKNGVAFEVIPGVTSAIAGAAYAGIPVTHREYTSSFHVITGQGKNGATPNINYDALVQLNGTLIFMMSVAVIDDICSGCISAGMDKNMPAAIVENATTGIQRKFIGTVETLPLISNENNIESPAVIIIGKVCQLSGQYDWFGQKPLLGKRILVARAKPGISKLSDSLRDLGCHVTELPQGKITALTLPGCLIGEKIKVMNRYSWLVFTSSVGVNVFFDYLLEIGYDIRSLHHLKIACVGSETEREVNKRGIKSDYVPSEYNGAALGHGLSKLVKSGERLLIARAIDAGEDLTRILTDAGITYDDVSIYEKTYCATTADIAKTIYENIDYAAFTSSSAVEWFVSALIGDANNAGNVGIGNANIGRFKGIKAVCIGERTASTARSYGMKVYVSEAATIESMVNKIMKLCL